MEIVEIFLVFLRIGLFSFGGGYAIIPLLQEEVLRHNWLTIKEFVDIVAVSQMTPGPIAVNLATFVGYKEAGVLGALLATIGVSIPSFVIIIIVIKLFMNISENKYVKNALFGLKAAVVGLIFAAVLNISYSEFLGTDINVKGLIICLFSFVVLYTKKANPFLIIGTSALIGLILF